MAVNLMLAFGMPSELSRDEVAAIAALANLQLDPEEIDLFARQLGAVLTYAEEVQRVDTTGVPPTSAVGTRNPADRPDEPRPSLPVEATLSNAPDAEPDSTHTGGFFKVPRVIG
jgi:aspartyl-tRNA(Asn)/glutamyl-tRNA(Gln) amidotransferase subunit C